MDLDLVMSISRIELKHCFINVFSSGKPGRRNSGGAAECDGLSVCRHIQQGTAEDLQLDGQRLLPQVPSLCSLH